MNVRRLSLLAAAAVAVALPAGSAQAAHAAGPKVKLKNLQFHPRTLHVARGTTVTWVWRDHGIAHNVTGAAFHSRTQSRGRFRVRFTHRGTFAYRCTIHPGMTGKVVVR